MGKIVRMADIAARLGVSTVTVSKALGDQKGVSEELRERIKQMAGEMGYKAPSANRSEEKKSYNIGVLVAEIYIEKYATFYWELYQKITTAAVKEDCFVLLEVLESAAEKELQDIKLIRENKIDGLIVLGSVSTEYLEQLCRGNDLPIVCMDFYDNKVKVDCVISNSFYGAYQLTNYLFDKGHQKIAFVGTLLATDSITDRYLGYQKSLMEHGVAVEQVGEFPVALCVGQISVDEQISGPDKAGGLHQLFHRDSPVTQDTAFAVDESYAAVTRGGIDKTRIDGNASGIFSQIADIYSPFTLGTDDDGKLNVLIADTQYGEFGGFWLI